MTAPNVLLDAAAIDIPWAGSAGPYFGDDRVDFWGGAWIERLERETGGGES